MRRCCLNRCLAIRSCFLRTIWQKRFVSGGIRISFREPADDHVKHGCEEDAEDGHAEHPAEHCHPQRKPHFGARPLGQDQRDYTQDEANDVIKMGRRRSLLASMVASFRPFPWS